MKRTIIAAIALAALTSNAFATNLDRCRDAGTRDGGTTTIIGETVTRFTAASGGPASGQPTDRCELPPVGSGKWTFGKPGFVGTSLCIDGGQTLALPGSAGGQPVKVKLPDTEIDNPDIAQFEDGTLDLKDTAKESAKAYAEAVKAELDAAKAEHRWPSLPDPRDHIVEVVDWNGAQDGSC